MSHHHPRLLQAIELIEEIRAEQHQLFVQDQSPMTDRDRMAYRRIVKAKDSLQDAVGILSGEDMATTV